MNPNATGSDLEVPADAPSPGGRVVGTSRHPTCLDVEAHGPGCQGEIDAYPALASGSWPGGGGHCCFAGCRLVRCNFCREQRCMYDLHLCEPETRDPSQTSTSVDALTADRAASPSAQKGTPDLATPGSDNAAGVAGTTGPTP